MMPQKEYVRLKARLTRAKNSGSREKVLAEVRYAVEIFDRDGWPDSWATWRIAAEDVCDFYDPELARVEELFR